MKFVEFSSRFTPLLGGRRVASLRELDVASPTDGLQTKPTQASVSRSSLGTLYLLHCVFSYVHKYLVLTILNLLSTVPSHGC